VPQPRTGIAIGWADSPGPSRSDPLIRGALEPAVLCESLNRKLTADAVESGCVQRSSFTFCARRRRKRFELGREGMREKCV
jgi:hypothetical protein